MAACSNCGGIVSKTARFCPHCAAPQRTGAGVQAGHLAARASEQADLCAIDWWHGYVKADFYASSIDADGREREIARSPRFSWWRGNPPPAGHEEARAAYDALVAELTESGWKPLGGSTRPWYATRLRRRPTALRALSDAPSGDQYGEDSASS